MFKLVVLFSVVAMAVAKPSVVTPLVYSNVVPGVSSLSQYSTSVVHRSPYLTTAPVVPAVALSQAPHSPAVILDAVNGVPLDTPEVVAARAAHYQAKALSGWHHLRKRSAPLTYSSVVAPVAYSGSLVSTYPGPLVSAYSAPAIVTSPISYHGVYPKALSVHPW